jgi:hypothetical protein
MAISYGYALIDRRDASRILYIGRTIPIRQQIRLDEHLLGKSAITQSIVREIGRTNLTMVILGLFSDLDDRHWEKRLQERARESGHPLRPWGGVSDPEGSHRGGMISKMLKKGWHSPESQRRAHETRRLRRVGFFDPETGRRGGRNVPLDIRRINGRKGGLIQSLEAKRKGGHLGIRHLSLEARENGRHTRWHTNRGIFNPECLFCLRADRS